jgi:hypothetical protein
MSISRFVWSNKRVSFVLTLTLLAGAVVPAFAAASTPEEQLVDEVKNGPLQKIGPWLANLYQEYQRSGNKKAFATKNPVLKLSSGKVGVDLYANDPAALKTSLTAMGATNIRSLGRLVSAEVPVSALGQLAGLASAEVCKRCARHKSRGFARQSREPG